jgi:hypothetical protein
VLGAVPNTDPGLAGETGVSGDSGIVYGIDGLKVGAGIEGTLSRKGGGADRPRFAPSAWPPRPPPRAWAGSISANEPSKVKHAARDNVASAIRFNFLLRIVISIEPIDCAWR